MIEFQNVKKVYQTKKQTVEALKGINLTVEKGDIFGVVGYSGAGKSTLIRLVNLLEHPSDGSGDCWGQGFNQIKPEGITGRKEKNRDDLSAFQLT